MEPITHAVVGMVLGCLGPEPVTVNNGILVASTLGAVAPDIDIISRFWGEFSYLKQHRGFSHSLPGLGLIAVILGLLLNLLYPQYGFTTLFLWAFYGALSHSLLDLLNSYGVKILWPFSRKRWAANLLMLFDPVLFILCVVLLRLEAHPLYGWIMVMVLSTYLFVRFLMRNWAHKLVSFQMLKRYPEAKITILPSKYNFFRWDFIVLTKTKQIVGNVDLLRRKFRIARRLHCMTGEIIKAINATLLGRVFYDFTPFYHIEYQKTDDKIVGRFIDLRYRVKDRFLHSGTLIMDEKLQVKEAIFQPFSLSNKIYLEES